MRIITAPFIIVVMLLSSMIIGMITSLSLAVVALILIVVFGLAIGVKIKDAIDEGLKGE